MTNLLQGRAAFLAIDIEALYEPSVEGKKLTACKANYDLTPRGIQRGQK